MLSGSDRLGPKEVLVDTPSNRIVVGVDGSPGSMRALRWALREAHTSNAEVEALLVWPDPWHVVGPPSLFGAGPKGVARLRTMLGERVEQAVRDEGAQAIRITHRVVAGNPAETLVAESSVARLLVVGSTGLSNLRRWMLGSVSQRCAQLSGIPVVIVPGPGDGTDPARDAQELRRSARQEGQGT